MVLQFDQPWMIYNRDIEPSSLKILNKVINFFFCRAINIVKILQDRAFIFRILMKKVIKK